MYSETISDILVFKTNIHNADAMNVVSVLLNSDQRITQWNIDQQDIDHVLRVESDQLEAVSIIKIINNAGYTCEELPD